MKTSPLNSPVIPHADEQQKQLKSDTELYPSGKVGCKTSINDQQGNILTRRMHEHRGVSLLAVKKSGRPSKLQILLNQPGNYRFKDYIQSNRIFLLSLFDVRVQVFTPLDGGVFSVGYAIK